MAGGGLFFGAFDGARGGEWRKPSHPAAANSAVRRSHEYHDDRI